MDAALIIFVKNLRYGKVKTRLAATTGNEKAYAIYKSLLEHTNHITKGVHAHKYVFYSDEIEDNDIWSSKEFNKKLQQGTDLGDKMKQAFEELFSKGYYTICIIGSDCLELTTRIIEQAFTALSGVDVAIGPASDGGYYLLGMKKLNPALFQTISWSTDQVFQQTTAICKSENLTHALLPVLNDIDEEKDWIKAVQTLSL